MFTFQKEQNWRRTTRKRQSETKGTVRRKQHKVSVSLEENGTTKRTVDVVNTKETHHRMKDMTPALYQATHPPHHHLNTR
jgi:hypothetical protein